MRKKTSFFDFLMLYGVAVSSWLSTAPDKDVGVFHGWGLFFDAADYMPIFPAFSEPKKSWKWLIDSTRVFTFCEIIHNISKFAEHKDCFYALGDDYPQLRFIGPDLEGSPFFDTRMDIFFQWRSSWRSDERDNIILAVTQASDEIKRLITGQQGSKIYLRDDPETESLLNELRRDFFDTDISLAKELGISKSTFEEVFRRQNRRMTIKMRNKIWDIAALKRREVD